MTLDVACALIGKTLQSRREIIDGILAAEAKPLPRLRSFMRAHSFVMGDEKINLQPVIHQLDQRSRSDGFNVLHDWDGKAERFNQETIPVDVLDFLIRVRDPDDSEGEALAILLDYYLFYLLGLLSLRVWDDGNPDQNVDRVSRLLTELQSPAGSGQHFADNWASLVLLATSHFEGEDRAYDQLLDRIRSLNTTHRTDAALVYAGVLACHLRFGLQAVYERDLDKLRADNMPDYPLLCFALSTLMERYAELSEAGEQGPERDRVAEGILNGLTPDAGAFLVDPPPALAPCEDERRGFCERFRRQKGELLGDFERLRPGDRDYSPLSLFFNFPHNLIKGAVVDALLRDKPWTVSLNDLLTGSGSGQCAGEAQQELAKTLMAYARTYPDPYRGKLVPSIVYDPRTGLRDWERAFAVIDGP
ncbi:MAG: hypothetical protein ACYTG5_17310 [Planctomycetota bacterium]|jgi:hypothetical protein